MMEMRSFYRMLTLLNDGDAIILYYRMIALLNDGDAIIL